MEYTKWVNWLIGVIIFLGVAEIGLPFLNDALGNISASLTGVPFIDFLARNGLVMLIVMVTIVVAVIKGAKHR